MTDTHYQICMQSPMGVKKGHAQVCFQEGRIVLELLGGENLFSGSFVPEYAFQMFGTLKTAVSELPGRLQGTVSEQGLRAVLHTDSGDFPIEGILSGGHRDSSL